MLILNENQKILSSLVLHRNRLEGMKNQLDNLLKKKLRLETEISKLKISIKKNSKSLDLKTRTSISLEAFEGPRGPLTSEAKEFLTENLPESIHLFVEIDSIEQEILELLGEFQEELDC